MSEVWHDVGLRGLDGSAPLGFLAALGTFAVADRLWSMDGEAVRMSWVELGGAWRPCLRVPRADAEFEHAILEELNQHGEGHPALAWTLYRDGDGPAIREWLANAPGFWGGAMGVEPVSGTDEGKRFSQLQTARKDYHCIAVAKLLAGITAKQLHRSLFREWDYGDQLDALSLHLDPSEDRRHAYQWNRPAGDPERKVRGNMIGANRLALEAYPLTTTVHQGDAARTVGFRGNRVRDTRWTWPIWRAAVTLDTARTLLAMSDIQGEQPDAARLSARGICVLFRSRRILVGKTPNLTPSVAIMSR